MGLNKSSSLTYNNIDRSLLSLPWTIEYELIFGNFKLTAFVSCLLWIFLTAIWIYVAHQYSHYMIIKICLSLLIFTINIILTIFALQCNDALGIQKELISLTVTV